MSCYESYQDTTESFSKCTELRANVSLCLKGVAGLNIISFLNKKKALIHNRSILSVTRRSHAFKK